MRRHVIVVVGMVLLALLLGPVARAAEHTLALKVVDAKEQKPIEGVTLKVNGYHGKQQIKGEYKTDAGGAAAIALPAAEVRYLSISVRKDGFVPMRAGWPARETNERRAQVPGEFVFPLEAGTTIGGKVMDDAGKPVEGAAIKLRVMKKFANPHVYLDLYDATPKSDAQGKWSYARVPAEFDSIELGAWHHQYATERGYYHTKPFEAVAQLRDGTAQLTMARGVKVQGVVYGADGKRLKDARVGVGADRVPSNVLPEQKTDENGKFTLGWKPGEMLVLTVKAKDHAPELQQLTVSADQRPLEFRLQPPKTLKGRIVDADGKPLAGVSIYTDTWRGCRTLDTRLTSDKEGRFEWKEAPADAVMCDIYTMGYADARNTSLTASDQEHVITLHKPLKVTGTVVDAQTNEPVREFAIVPGITFDDKRISWQRRHEQTKGRDGKFEHEQTYPYPGYAIRIEAPGYMPADSRIFRMADREVSLEFKLEKGAGIGGIVRGADGKPVAGAKVIVATPDQTAYLRNGTEVNDQGNVTAESDASGQYTLPPLTGTYALVITHNSGYAELPRDQAEKSGDVTLQPWARIEGMVLIAGKPAAKSEISVSRLDERYDEKAPRIYHQVDAESDSAGKFVIARVRPGKLSVSRTVRIPMSAQSWMNSPTHTARVEAKAGETATVQLGGTGRPVIGRAAIPAELAARKDWRFAMCQLSTSMPKPPAIPEHVKAMSAEERKTWHEEWSKSEEFKAYQAASEKARENYSNYALLMQPDGSFRADDVPAGTYDIMIQAAKPDPSGACGPGDTLASAGGQVTIPEIPGGRSDEAVDAGTLEMKIIKQGPQIGDAAPAFAVKTLDGKDLKLADFKGKVVLIDFWATWCGPCIAEMPSLKALYDEHGGNGNFVMISLSLDEKESAPKEFAEKNGIKWIQGFVGSWEAPAVQEYGVRGIPSVWLIGPDGKVIAKNLRGESAKQAVAKALSSLK